MFAGRNRSSSNVKTMQLFYELKQLHPTASDAALNACIASYVQSNVQRDKFLFKLPETDLEQMGRTPAPSSCQQETCLPESDPCEATPFEMDRSVGDVVERAVMAEKLETQARPAVKRPSHLDLKCDIDSAFGGPVSDVKGKFNIRLSEKCKNVHKLLNSDVSDKPPPSPSSVKRLTAVKVDRSPLVSPDAQNKQEDRSADVQKRLAQVEDPRKDPPPAKKETCSTPTQTTDTLIASPNVNLSLNVNCSLDLLHSPLPETTRARRTSAVQLVPAQPWLLTPTSTPSPRSFTSVNLTLRPPGTAPHDPIDITSKNSSLTYSTSSFDSTKGLQSRLQITVGPAGGSVSSVRVRPRSYQEEGEERVGLTGRVRTGSLNDLAGGSERELPTPLILKQQARIERLRIEMKTRRSKLEAVKQEIEELEKNRLRLSQQESENRLLMEIKHLTWQCKDLESDGDAFYSNIYTGQHGPLTLDLAPARPDRRLQPTRRPPPRPTAHAFSTDAEGPKWNCGMCTFLNHPVLDKCEQCEMPRIVHGRKAEAVNPNVTIDALKLLNNNNGVKAASRSLSLSNAAFYGGDGRPVGRLDSSRSVPNVLGLGHRKKSEFER